MKNDQEIRALVSLLDDPDEFIFSEVRNKLMELGGDTIPFLEEYWENNPINHESQERIEDLIQQIQFDSTFTKLERWISLETPDLFRGAILINQFQYPDMDPKVVSDSLEKIKRDI